MMSGKQRHQICTMLHCRLRAAVATEVVTSVATSARGGDFFPAQKSGTFCYISATLCDFSAAFLRQGWRTICE
ncbi:MAG: hypothetical protein LBH06_05430 [Rikenellaceae bacterium]|jgi:hypothetical protein|nr:hypothetical protein [Rikenellaceae bacterium]